MEVFNELCLECGTVRSKIWDLFDKQCIEVGYLKCDAGEE